MSNSPSNPKGTRDFLPEEFSKRDYIIEIIKNNFLAFGFSQIETPSIEKNATLLGKYGEDGDRLIFRILNSGEKIKKADLKAFQKDDFQKFIKSISEKGLRYDLTVPLARFVAQHQNDIIFPFKRFQIQNVWRADRPQFGRYQEFTQCDADIIGKSDIIQEIELLQLYDSVFSDLGFKNVVIKINHRSILYYIANYLEVKENHDLFFTIIDKIEKNTKEKIHDDLKNNFENFSLTRFIDLFETEEFSIEKLSNLLNISKREESGFKEVQTILNFFNDQKINNRIEFDLKLARGLNYYTGLIVEVSSDSNDVGSLGGGGRYDNLTSLFNLKDTSGIGISFGLERIYLEMNRKSMFPLELSNRCNLLFVNFGTEYIKNMYPTIQKFRKHGLKVEIYPFKAKLNKQLTYANKSKINYVLIFGEDESVKGNIIIKDMFENKQSSYKLEELSYKLFRY